MKKIRIFALVLFVLFIVLAFAACSRFTKKPALSASPDGQYIWLGEYPQTIKSDDVTISETQDARGYWLGSDGAYYAKQTTFPDLPNERDHFFSTGAEMNAGTVYYFKVEPIKWRILSESEGVALILCETVIDQHCFDQRAYSIYSDHNYVESEIRAWLNDQFYNTAFSKSERRLILTTTVDNISTPWSEYPFSYANTEDKVFLLSDQEASNTVYGFSAYYAYDDAARMKTASDYVRAAGCFWGIDKDEDNYGNGAWWLRSGKIISRNGRLFGGETVMTGQGYVEAGIVPAMRIRIE